MDSPENGHDSVLLAETIDLLNLKSGQVVADCTLGRGGHSTAIAQRIAPGGLLLALDADPRNLTFARDRLASAPAPVRFFHANFAELPDVLSEAGIPAVDAILADLGLSTNQLFDPEYGLSFAQPMPLDMRIDPRTPQTAADLLQQLSETDLANVLYKQAQEHYSRRIARKIVEARRSWPITTTDRLAELVRSAIPLRGGPPPKIDPATKTFMALRMEVNQEIENLATLLEQGPRFLKPGGRLGVISFHSTEDRMVKQAFRSAEQAGLLKTITKKPLSPTDDETARNPRSRSAKLRVAERT
jgi:16S rRNA (cytosine1402-N4)-methyltransferase